MHLLSAWLYIVASLRLVSVYIGIFQPWTLQQRLFPLAPAEAGALYGRTFATWTAATCVLTLATAYESPHPRSGLFLACLASFVLALSHFTSELLWHGTMTVASAVSPFFVATLSTLWMGWLVAAAAPAPRKKKV
jgi:hypothetical protein